MARYVALLRAVNVGGTGKLSMQRLRALCEAAGLSDVQTYIQSGNVVCDGGRRREAGVKRAVEAALEQEFGKPVGVMVRAPDELRWLLDANPFPDAAPNKVIVWFLDDEPPAASVVAPMGRQSEELRIVGRHIVVHYPDGQGRSKLKLPGADVGTGRNLNTVRKLLEMAEGG